MSSQHKHHPVSFRPPEADRAWLYQHAKQAGRSIGAILSEALAAYRAAHEPASGKTTTAGGKTTRARKPAPGTTTKPAPEQQREASTAPPRCPPKGWCAHHETWHGKQ